MILMMNFRYNQNIKNRTEIVRVLGMKYGHSLDTNHKTV